MNNLELHKQISFDELVEIGIKISENIVNGVPYSFSINGIPITHKNDDCYVIETVYGIKNFHKGEYLIAFESGLVIMKNHGDSHAPNGCPI